MTTYIEPPKSEDCEWLTGYPDEPGWYPASFTFPPDPTVLRFYFGDGQWSSGFSHDTDPSYFMLFGDPKPNENLREGQVLWAKPWWPVPDQAQETSDVQS